MVDWLQAQPWCGVIFTSNGNGIEGAIPGTFDRSLVMADHARAPEIYYVMRNDDNTDSNGVIGGCYYDGKYPEGGSVHGGLHEKELNTLLVAQGSRFRKKFQCDNPAGVIDIAPTLLHLLGVSIPTQMSGRVLGESVDGYGLEVFKPEKRIYTVGNISRQQYLQVSGMGASVYFDKAWVGEKRK
jgi:arylsulfatase A-like enzyme